MTLPRGGGPSLAVRWLLVMSNITVEENTLVENNIIHCVQEEVLAQKEHVRETLSPKWDEKDRGCSCQKGWKVLRTPSIDNMQNSFLNELCGECGNLNHS